jgi:glucose-6-phosphate isomerase
MATSLASWAALAAHHAATGKKLVMRDLFAADPARASKLSITHDFGDGALLFDYSKNIVTEETLKLLFDVARESNVEKGRDSMFSGEKINFTEQRAVLHTALRNKSERPVLVDGQDVMPEVRRVLKQMREFSNAVRNGVWLGYTGKVRMNGCHGPESGVFAAACFLACLPAPTRLQSIPAHCSLVHKAGN